MSKTFDHLSVCNISYLIIFVLPLCLNQTVLNSWFQLFILAIMARFFLLNYFSFSVLDILYYMEWPLVNWMWWNSVKLVLNWIIQSIVNILPVSWWSDSLLFLIYSSFLFILDIIFTLDSIIQEFEGKIISHLGMWLLFSVHSRPHHQGSNCAGCEKGIDRRQ